MGLTSEEKRSASVPYFFQIISTHTIHHRHITALGNGVDLTITRTSIFAWLFISPLKDIIRPRTESQHEVKLNEHLWFLSTPHHPAPPSPLPSLSTGTVMALREKSVSLFGHQMQRGYISASQSQSSAFPKVYPHLLLGALIAICSDCRISTPFSCQYFPISLLDPYIIVLPACSLLIFVSEAAFDLSNAQVNEAWSPGWLQGSKANALLYKNA